MGNFSVSSNLFAEYDDLYFADLKRKKAEDILKRKQAVIESFQGLPDADTFTYSDPLTGNTANTRAGADNVTLDTAETFKGFGKLYAEGRPGVRDNHAKSLAADLGLHHSQITDDMLNQRAEESKAYAKQLLLAEQPDVNAPTTQVTTKGTDKYGRPITESVNPFTGVNINRALNTPKHNLDYWSKYNNPDKANYAELGDDNIPNFVIDQNEDGTYNFHVRGGLKNPELDNPEEERTERYRIDPLDVDGDTDENRIVGGRYDTFTRNNLSGTELENWVSAFKDISQLDSEVFLVDGTSIPIKWSGHVPEEKLREEVGTFTEMAYRAATGLWDEFRHLSKEIKGIRVPLPGLVHVALFDSPEATAALQNVLENAPVTATVMEKARVADKYSRDIQNVLTTPEEKFRSAEASKLKFVDYIEDLYSNRKEEAFSMLADSTALMLEISAGLPGKAAAVVSTNGRIQEGFVEHTGREPSLEEKLGIYVLSTFSVAGETFGFRGLTGKFKGLNKIVTSLTAKNPAFGRFLAKTFIGGTAGLIAEGTSGVISNTAETMGIHIADGVTLPSMREQRESFWLEAMPGHLISTTVSAVDGATSSSDQATLDKLVQQLQNGTDTVELTVNEETAINTKIDKLDTKLRQSDLSDAHREKLSAKKEELRDQINNGAPNKNALSEDSRKALIDSISTLEGKIEAKATSKEEKAANKESTKELKTANKQLKTLDKQIFKLQQAERNEEEDAELKAKEAQAKQLEIFIQGATKTESPTILQGDSVEVLQEVSTRLENSDELNLEEVTALVDQYTSAANDVMQRFVKGETDLQDLQQDSFRKVGEYEKLLDERVDLTEARETVAANNEKESFVYSLDYTDESSVGSLNDILAQGILTPEETKIVEAKREVVEARQEITSVVKTIEDVNEDITGKGSSDFVSFNQHLDRIKSGENDLSARSGLEQFAKHMQGKAETLRGAYETFLKTHKVTTVDYNGTSYKINNSTATLLEYVEKEAAYGQKVLGLSEQVSTATVNRLEQPEDTELTSAKRQLSLNERLLTKIDKIKKTAPQEESTPPPKPTENTGTGKLNAALGNTSSADEQAKPVKDAPKAKQKKHAPVNREKITNQIAKLVKRGNALIKKSDVLDENLEKPGLFPGTLEVPTSEAVVELRAKYAKLQDRFKKIAEPFDLDIKYADILENGQEAILFDLLDGAIALGVPSIESKIRAIGKDFAEYEREEESAEENNIEDLKRLAELQKNIKRTETKSETKDTPKQDSKKTSTEAKQETKTKQESVIPDISTVQLIESGAAYEQGGVAKVYAIGHYSKAQWITIAKKLGVLPDVC